MSEKTFRAIMGELAEAFVEDTRTDGSKFVRLRDGHPEWMRDAVREAHGDWMPNDRHYNAIRAMAEGLSERTFEAETWDGFDAAVCDACHELADSQVDDYTSALLLWLAEAPGALDACDEAAEEGLVDASADMETRIKCGQYRWYEQIGQTICRVLDGELSAREAEVSK